MNEVFSPTKKHFKRTQSHQHEHCTYCISLVYNSLSLDKLELLISEGIITTGDAKRNREHKKKRDGVIKHTKQTHDGGKKGGNMSEQKEKEEEEQKLSEKTEVKDYS